MNRGTILFAVIGLVLSGVCAGTRAEASPGYRHLALGGYAIRWVPPSGTERIVLRYAVADREINQPTGINCRRMGPPDQLTQRSGISPGSFRRAMSEAFQRWREVADVTFLEAAAGERADIVIGEQLVAQGYAFTNLELGDELPGKVRPIVGATICLNPQRRWKIGYDGNLEVYDLVHTLTHEIGHAIGLDHPSPLGHVMSFRYSETHAGLTEGDVLGAVKLYGPSRILAATAPSVSGAGRPTVTTTIGRGIDSGPE